MLVPDASNYFNKNNIFKSTKNVNQAFKSVNTNVICRTSCIPQESLHDMGGLGGEKKTGFTITNYQKGNNKLKQCLLMNTTQPTDPQQKKYFYTTHNSDWAWFNSMVLPMQGNLKFEYNDLYQMGQYSKAPGKVCTKKGLGCCIKKTLSVLAGPFVSGATDNNHGRTLAMNKKNSNITVPNMKKINIDVIVAARGKELFKDKTNRHKIWNIFDIKQNRDKVPGRTKETEKPETGAKYFLIFDYGMELLSYLSENVDKINFGKGGKGDITMNIMHSVLTYSDSAPNKCIYDQDLTKKGNHYREFKADIQVQEKKSNNIYRAIDWEVTSPLLTKIDNNNPVFLSSYAIEIKKNPKQVRCQDVTQTWKLGGKSTNVVYPRENNNIKNCSKILREAKNLSDANFALQRKRSGDHFQIWFAYIFPLIAAKYVYDKYQNKKPVSPFKNNKNFIYHKFDEPPGVNNKWSQGKIEKWYKEHTFFVTHDGPAAVYAIMCGVSVILNNNLRNGGFLASFNVSQYK